MRLVGAVRRLEAGAAAARARAKPGKVGIVWTKQDCRVDASVLAEGELIAVDITVLPGADGSHWWRIAERVTADPADLGVVYRQAADGAVSRVGAVVSIDADLVRYELDGAGVGEFVRSPDRRP